MKKLTISTLTLGIVLAASSCDFSKSREALFGVEESNHSINASSSTSSTKKPQSKYHYNDIDYAKVPSHAKEQIINYEGFRVSFNAENHTPNWVAWELLESETDGQSTRANNSFWQDPEVKGCPVTKDYTRSGYDRGHMCPAADQKWSEKAMNDCFVLTNMCPQAHELNTGAWKTLEQKERLWAKRDSALVIIAGPIYSEADKQRIGENKVRVPSAFYKVIVAPYLPSPRGIGFIYPNMSAPGNMMDYVMSIDDVEEITGIDFFCNLPDSIEHLVESTTSFREWNRK